MEKPTIAALSGPAAGAGFALALSCDLRVAAESAFVTTSYARLGLSGDYGCSWFLTQLVGTSRARELFFTSDRLDARECERLGIVNRVYADDEFEAESLKLARQIASGPPIALGYMKENLNRATLAGDLETAMRIEADRMVRGAQTDDYREAINAFNEKRAPVFRGR
jgi:enoyl-CoA hydratase/carnithine racemase